MLKFGVVLAWWLAADVAWCGEAANECPPVRLAADLSDGSHLIGTPVATNVGLHTSLGLIEVPFAQMLSMTFRDAESASVSLANGDRISGVHDLTKLRFNTLMGEVSIDALILRKIERISGGNGPTRKGLVLWNRLDSESDVAEGCVGPGGVMKAGRFVPGRFGKGVELTMQEPFGVTFPAKVVPGPDGCIEFWAKLVDFPTELAWGDRPGLIAACAEDGSCGFMLHFNGNDGSSNGGLCARVAGLCSAGTGTFGTWTYSRALGADNVGDWHHYALAWATDGIPGVDNGARKAAVYVDGKLNTTVWNGGIGNKLEVPTTGQFGFLHHQGLTTGRVVFDNLKIWNYAKTDFADRNNE